MDAAPETPAAQASPGPWPHAPPHRLDTQSTFFVTGSTYEKAHYFQGASRLNLLHNTLLQEAKSHGWQLEAWAVFPNHYHFVARPDSLGGQTSSLRDFINKLHTVTATVINEHDKSPARKVWHNYWDTRLTYHNAYIARLNYVHNNPVKHGLTPVASNYYWCSAAWFALTASAAWLRTVSAFKTDRLKIPDDF